jgi:hypothetical protein
MATSMPSVGAVGRSCEKTDPRQAGGGVEGQETAAAEMRGARWDEAVGEVRAGVLGPDVERFFHGGRVLDSTSLLSRSDVRTPAMLALSSFPSQADLFMGTSARGSTCPRSFTPCSANTFLARSIPTFKMAMTCPSE